MTNTVKLKQKINESGYKLEHLASELGITRASFSMKLNNQSSFKVEEMYKLSDLIGLNEVEAKEIFFDTE